MEKKSQITLGFTTFCTETVPFAEKAMANHDLIILEEPQTPCFEEMLQNEKSIDDYIQLTEFEFPRYVKAQCVTLRNFYSKGVEIKQIHPWLDELYIIQEFLAAGNSPKSIKPETKAFPIYQKEKQWTAKLIAYYKAIRQKNFDLLCRAVLEFAKNDAQKIKEQDRLRTHALKKAIPQKARTYIECGSIHLTMILFLKRYFEKGQIRIVHLMEDVCKERFKSRRLLPPGDILTFRYLFKAPYNQKAERDLAAKAIVYNRLILKDEVSSSLGSYPKLENEALVIGLVSGLSYTDCERIYKKTLLLSTEETMEFVLKMVRH